jgi:hypothetical protein
VKGAVVHLQVCFDHFVQFCHTGAAGGCFRFMIPAPFEHQHMSKTVKRNRFIVLSGKLSEFFGSCGEQLCCQFAFASYGKRKIQPNLLRAFDKQITRITHFLQQRPIMACLNQTCKRSCLFPAR